MQRLFPKGSDDNSGAIKQISKRNQKTMTSQNKGNKTIYDVAICGSGLAGLTLARQLKLNKPNLSIIALDRLGEVIPETTLKVGESTVYPGAYYLSHVLQLEDYFQKNHFLKLGPRFFFGDGRGLFQERPELGLSEFPPFPESYQIDRGHLEKELRLLNQQKGVEIKQNCSVKDIELSEEPEKPHKIIYSQKDENKTNICEARWVIDAMGRRRFLQKKLGLGKPNDPNFNAVWFRVQGRIDVSDFVPIAERSWHDRVPENKRYYSTNHLCGEGYWIWLIPLASGHTSIGIVAKEEIHSFKEFHTYRLAYKWLEKYEPVLANALKEKQPADFKKMPKYSYSSSQVFSINRLATVGDAGVFPDPFYSPGMNLIGYGNSLVTQAIELDIEGKLTQEQIDKANNFYLSLNDKIAESIHNTYSVLNRPVIMTAKFIWDLVTGMPPTSLFFNSNSLLLDLDKKEEIGKNNALMSQLAERMEPFF